MLSVRSRAVTWGAVCWVSAIQFFLAQWITAQAILTPFSLRYNHISDLGNTACSYPPANALPSPANAWLYVCSPLHTLMNGSFVLLGITLCLGAILTWNAFARSPLRAIGLTLIALAGICLVVVGFAPENVNLAAHGAAAALQFIGGNLALILMGALLARHQHARFGLVSILLGILGFAGLVMLGATRATSLDFGLGIGGWEAFAVYPLPIWAISAGLLILIQHWGAHPVQAPTPSEHKIA